MKQNQPRGLRENNPGNIRHGDKWQGLAKIQADPSFCTFETPQWGIRALARVLIAYQDKHELDTVERIISRWAPPNENDTGAYVRAVAQSMGVEIDDIIDVYQYDVMNPLVRAIIKHENGEQPYPTDVIDEGLRRAGVVRKRRASHDPQILTTAAAGASTATVAGGVLYTEIKQVSDDLRSQGKESGSTDLMLAGSGISIIAVGILGYMVIRRWKMRQ